MADVGVNGAHVTEHLACHICPYQLRWMIEVALLHRGGHGGISEEQGNQTHLAPGNQYLS